MKKLPGLKHMRQVVGVHMRQADPNLGEQATHSPVTAWVRSVRACEAIRKSDREERSVSTGLKVGALFNIPGSA